MYKLKSGVYITASTKYLEAFERKEYRPELLFDDKIILDNICSHPMALWKMKESREKEHNHADRH